MANTSILTLGDDDWLLVAEGPSEALVTSDGRGFFYVIREAKPAATLRIGHVVDGVTNEAVVLLTGEALYARSRAGAITLAATIDDSE